MAAIEAGTTNTALRRQHRPDHLRRPNNAHALFGDQSGLIIANEMDGVTYQVHRLPNIANAGTLFDYQGVRVVDILGRARGGHRDAPGAARGIDRDQRRQGVGLAQGAATVYLIWPDPILNTQTTNGKERIETTMQADYTFGLAPGGFAGIPPGRKVPDRRGRSRPARTGDKVASSWKPQSPAPVTGTLPARKGTREGRLRPPFRLRMDETRSERAGHVETGNTTSTHSSPGFTPAHAGLMAPATGAVHYRSGQQQRRVKDAMVAKGRLSAW